MDTTRRVAATAFVQQPSLRPAQLLRQLRDPFPPVAGLLVDLCGVLYDDSAWPRWLFWLVHKLGLHTTYTPFFRLWRREYLERVKHNELEYWQALRLFLRASGLSRGQTDEVEAASHARRRSYESELMALPGVAHTLAQLQDQGTRLALFSTTWHPQAEVERRLHCLGLRDYFSAVVAYPELYQQAAGRSVFTLAQEATGLRADRLAFVARDAAALSDAGSHGMQRVAVNYDDDVVADVFLRSFDRIIYSLQWDLPAALADA